jgi:hypothetical protein
MFGEACDILLIKIIWRSIIGASSNLTPKPHSTKNGNQAMPVPAWTLINIDAQALNAGAPQAQINGSEYTFAGLCA